MSVLLTPVFDDVDWIDYQYSREGEREGMRLKRHREVVPYYSTKYGTALLGDARQGLTMFPDGSVDQGKSTIS